MSSSSVKVPEWPPCEGMGIWEFWLLGSFPSICFPVYTLRTPVKTCPKVYIYIPNFLLNNSTLMSSRYLNLTYLKPKSWSFKRAQLTFPHFPILLNGNIILAHVQAPGSWDMFNFLLSHLAFNPLVSSLGFPFKIYPNPLNYHQLYTLHSRSRNSCFYFTSLSLFDSQHPACSFKK